MEKNDNSRALTLICKIIRILTAPAILAVMLSLILMFTYGDAARSRYILLALFTGVIPVLSYPVCFFVPALKRKGRDFERKAAFVSSTVGYTGGVIWAAVSDAPKTVKIVCLTYFLSVLFLILFNKVLKIKASGHACGIFGPLLTIVMYAGYVWIIPCAVILLLVCFSSLYLKRHTLLQLFLGMLCSGTALFLSAGIVQLIPSFSA